MLLSKFNTRQNDFNAAALFVHYFDDLLNRLIVGSRQKTYELDQKSQFLPKNWRLYRPLSSFVSLNIIMHHANDWGNETGIFRNDPSWNFVSFPL